jgi:hypothetical protein
VFLLTLQASHFLTNFIKYYIEHFSEINMPNIILVLFVVHSMSQNVAVAEFVLTNPSLTSVGTWHPEQRCPPESFVVSFDLATYVHSDPFIDDSLGVIHIVFQCSNVLTPDKAEAFISTAVSGVNYLIQHDTMSFSLQKIDTNISVSYTLPLRGSCEGVGIGFQLNSQDDQGSGDDTGANNLRVFCSGLKKNSPAYVEGFGNYNGEWTSSQYCGPRQAICGVQSQSVDLIAEGILTTIHFTLVLKT